MEFEMVLILPWMLVSWVLTVAKVPEKLVACVLVSEIRVAILLITS